MSGACGGNGKDASWSGILVRHATIGRRAAVDRSRGTATADPPPPPSRRTTIDHLGLGPCDDGSRGTAAAAPHSLLSSTSLFRAPYLPPTLSTPPPILSVPRRTPLPLPP
eukprot:633754-Pyramimonas_sp.AAC.1